MDSSSFECEQTRLIQKIESVPNLRLLCTRSQSNIDKYGRSDQNERGAIYRSSKPDRITADDVVHFKELGIKTMLDFRSQDEYTNSDGLCFLDKSYSLYKVLLPKKYTPEDVVESKLLAKQDVPRDSDNSTSKDYDGGVRKHFLINFFSASYVLTAMKRVPWYLLLLGVFHAVYDFFKKNKFKTFISFFIQHSVNRGEITGQYKDIVDVSGSAICAALKLVSNPENMPVLINCAHGKDRTGIVSALILLSLGKSEDYVKKEYSLSEKGLEPIQHIMQAEMVEKLKLRQCFLEADPKTMSELLSYIKERYGSVPDYLCHIGFDLNDQQRLRDNLIAFENPDCVSADDDCGSNVDIGEFGES